MQIDPKDEPIKVWDLKPAHLTPPGVPAGLAGASVCERCVIVTPVITFLPDLRS